MTILTDPDGRPMTICGYAAVYGMLSDPLADRGGLREVLMEGAFRPSAVDRPRALFAHHPNVNLDGAELEVWGDESGIAFEATRIPATSIAAGIVWAIGTGATVGASFSAQLHGGIAERHGERVFAVTSITGLTDVSIAARGAYAEPGCWLAHHDRLPPHLDTLRACWSAGRPARRVHPGPTAAQDRVGARGVMAHRPSPAPIPDFAEAANAERHARRFLARLGGG